jgi:predicted Zn-dependent protease
MATIKKFLAWLPMFAVAALLLQGCSTVPVTGRSQLNLISSQQEMELGLTSFQELKQQTPILKDPAINAMVQKVGSRVAAVAQKDMPNAQWEFVVFDTAEANAFCLPGGKVGVFKGILPITKDEGGLATVIGHEVAHAVARHGAERMSEAMVMQGGGQVVGATLSKSDPVWQQAGALAYGTVAKVGRELPHSRSQESEADQIGLIYMARAGYDPEEAVKFWQRFSDFNKQAGADNTFSFLRTHPLDDVRIKQLQQWMPQAKSEFVKQPVK